MGVWPLHQRQLIDRFYRASFKRTHCGHIQPNTITARESEQIKAYCTARVRKQQQTIYEVHRRGSNRIARREQQALIQGWAARLLAAYEGRRKLCKARRRKGAVVSALCAR